MPTRCPPFAAACVRRNRSAKWRAWSASSIRRWPSDAWSALSRAPPWGAVGMSRSTMQQAADLFELIEEIRKRDSRLSFGLFTGYTERELASGRYFCVSLETTAEKVALWARIRLRLDFAGMGPYNQGRPDIGRA